MEPRSICGEIGFEEGRSRGKRVGEEPLEEAASRPVAIIEPVGPSGPVRQGGGVSANGRVCVNAEQRDVFMAEFEQKCVDVGVECVGYLERLARVRGIARDEDEREHSATRVVYVKSDGQETRRREKEFTSGGFPGRDGAIGEPNSHALRTTPA